MKTLKILAATVILAAATSANAWNDNGNYNGNGYGSQNGNGYGAGNGDGAVDGDFDTSFSFGMTATRSAE